MKKKNKKFLVQIIVVLLFSCYAAFVVIQWPLVALGVKSEDGKWVVDEILDNGWAYHQTIELGDVILEIDGEDPDNNHQVAKKGMIRTADVISFLSKNGERKELIVTYQFGLKQLLGHLIIPFFYMLLTLYTVIYIFRKKSEEPSALILIQFLLCIAIAYDSAGASSRGDILARLVNALTFAGCLILNIRFLNTFLERLQINFIKQSNLRKLYGFLIVIFVGNVFVFIVPGFKEILSLVELSIFSFLLILTLFLLIKSYSKYKDKPGNQAVKLLAAIFILAFSPFALLYAMPLILFSKYIMKAEIVCVFLLLIPISFIYLQLAERLFDIEYILDRFKYYSVLAFPFSFLTFGLILLSMGGKLSSVEMIIIFIVLFVSSILFLYIKEWMDYKNRKYMFSTRGDMQTNMYNFFHKTKDENKVQVVVERILQEMESTLNVPYAVFVEIYQQETTKAWSVSTKLTKEKINIEELEIVKWEYESVGTILSLSRGFAVVVGSDVGVKKVIICDEKKTGTKLNIEEKSWIEMMAYFASVVVENMKLIEGLVDQIEELKLQETNDHPTWLSRLLFALSEKERANLSNDLHDSILQEQLQLLREVDSIRHLVIDQDIKSKLDEIKEQMLDNVHLIRETCMELRPPLLNERGLSESLHQLIRQTKLRCNFLLYVSLDEKIHMSKDKELIFYRIFQELFNNAMKHSDAKEVHLDFYQEDSSIILKYRDDGVGLELKEGYSFSSMGLVGINERIRSINGHLEIVSSKGQGMKIRIEVEKEDD
ncbi:sensor histidine kinase [Bacillus sp. FJAT-22090]|uniref:sensor histidine kinase n=1 Tax=Bacillus sp. FJAT-22090 TaxID=1581038 RepID=UPI0011A1BF69|nr:ATP-binding protein [Bacillus sp. FJAT-22090]